VQRRLALATAPARGLAVDGDHAFRQASAGRNPGGEAPLELLGVKRGEDVAEVIVARRAIGEWPQPPQQPDLLLAEQGDLGDMLRPGQCGHQAQQQDLFERIGDFALLTRVRQVLEVRQKANPLGNRRQNRIAAVHDPFLPCKVKERIDSAL
jgi:hypothetical protein